LTCTQPLHLDQSLLIEEVTFHWALVAHACNPSYSGSRDQEDHSSKPAQANSPRDPILKKPSQKRAGVGPG
jgi:hypothetical protein